MRFLLDECLPARMAVLLRAAGHDCVHAYDSGLGGQPDQQVMACADRENRILISADTDFGELLATAPVVAPSVILLRRSDKRPESLAAIIVANLDQVADDLAVGALVVISDTRIRARLLPMKSPTDHTEADAGDELRPTASKHPTT